MDMAEITKDITIFIVLSPFFLTVFALAILLKKGFDGASKHSIFWLFFSIVMAAAYLYQLFNGISSYRFFWGIFVIVSGVSTYLSLKAGGK